MACIASTLGCFAAKSTTVTEACDQSAAPQILGTVLLTVLLVPAVLAGASPPGWGFDRPENRSLACGPVTLDAEAERARRAARNGDCSTVQAIDLEVRDLDPEFFKTVFLRDVAISLCKPPADPEFFCTASPVVAELCFCSNAHTACEERQRSLTAMGATMSRCTASSTVTCRP
jgi:hypothetical protein